MNIVSGTHLCCQHKARQRRQGPTAIRVPRQLRQLICRPFRLLIGRAASTVMAVAAHVMLAADSHPEGMQDVLVSKHMVRRAAFQLLGNGRQQQDINVAGPAFRWAGKQARGLDQ